MKKHTVLILGICFYLGNIFAQSISYESLYTESEFDQITPNTSLPVGATPGSADVTNGNSSYIIPLQIPAGTNGVEPDISLAYSSQGANGHFGYGWNLTGISAIHRAFRTIHHDGYAKGINFNDDAYQMNGMRIIEKTPSVYVKEMNDYSTIEAMGSHGSGPAWFKMTTKTGVVMEYGKENNSAFKTEDGTEILSWSISKVIYQDGNYMQYIYASGDRDHRLTEILYTGNTAAGLSPYNSIKINYKERGITNVKTYEAGSAMDLDHLVSDIVITTENNAVVKSYEFGYATDDQNAFLKSVTEKGSDGTALNPTTFLYGAAEEEFLYEFIGYHPMEDESVSIGDFNGDGYSDKLVANIVAEDGQYYHDQFQIWTKSPTASNNTFFPNASQQLPQYGQLANGTSRFTFYSGDLTGEGRDDIIYTFSSAVNSDIRKIDEITFYAPNSTANSVDSVLIPLQDSHISYYSIFHSPLNIGDFNGDGIMDLLLIAAELGGSTLVVHRAYIYYGNISTQFEQITISGAHDIPIIDWGVQDISIIDIDGNGRSELMVTTDTGTELFSIEDDIVSSINGAAITYPNFENLIFFGDFNGDRKTDVLTRSSQSDDSSDWHIGLSNGFSFIQSSTPFDWINGYPVIDDHYNGNLVQLADFNGDGKTDIVYGQNLVISQILNFYFSTGNSWDHKTHTISGGTTNHHYGVQDINGDGKAEILNRADDILGTTKVLKYNSEGEEYLLKKIKNGQGHLTKFNYDRLTETATYIRSGFTDHPNNTIELPMYVASFMRIDGLAGTTYDYKNAMLNKEGKGLLGFEKITKSTIGNIREETNFVFDTNLNSYIPQTIERIDGTTVLSRRTITHDVQTYNDAIENVDYYTKMVIATIDDNIYEGTTVSTNTTYDNFGNALNSTLNIDGIQTTTTTTTYSDDGTPIPAMPTEIITQTTRGGTSFSSTTSHSFNAQAQLISKTVNPGTVHAMEYNYGYNTMGNPVSTQIIAPNETPRVSSSTFDTRGRHMTSSLNTMGQLSSSDFDAKWSKPNSTVGVNGLQSTFEFDSFGRPIKETTPLGFDVTTSYAWGGDGIYTKTISHPGASNITIHYDELNRVIKVVEQGYNLTKVNTTTYDIDGNIITEVGPTGFTTTYNYDNFNRPISVTNTFGTSTINYSYSGGKLTTTTTDAGGRVKSTVKDATNKVLEATDYGGTLNYSYHANGNVIDVSDGTNVLVSSTYDEYGRQISLIDKNAGTHSYEYDAFGQLISETNGNGHTTTMEYTILGQLEERIGVEGTTNYKYYLSGPEINQIEQVSSFEGDVENYSYDNYGRLNNQSHTVDGTNYSFDFAYDQYSNITSKIFPSGYELKYVYNADGYLDKITNASGTETIFQNVAMTALDQYEEYKSVVGGNTKTIELNYNHNFPTYIKNTIDIVLNYSWDVTTGNLLNRSTVYNGQGSHVENFTYDNLDRLLNQSIVGGNSYTLNYAPNGNILDKDDAGTDYGYDTDKINAINCITAPDYNNLSIYNQDIIYTSFLQPQLITENDQNIEFIYGSDYERLKSTFTKSDGSIEERLYFGDYETFDDGNGTKHLHYVNVGRGIHMIVVREGGIDTYYNAMTDYQGSLLFIGDGNGDDHYFNYDAWGRHRDISSLDYIGMHSGPAWINRGYTGHEHLDAFQIINMNGRLYDPVIGRMLSPDNNIQLPYNTQNYNRYSYALNNPLRYTDPDGEFIVPAIIGAAISVVTNGISNISNHKSFFDGAGKAAVIGAISGAVSSGIGHMATDMANGGVNRILVAGIQAVAHGYSGAFFSALSGGSVLSGFASGGLSSVVSSVPLGSGDGVVLLKGAVAGGIGSSVSGGNFWSGVRQGLITSGLNHLAHEMLADDCCATSGSKDGIEAKRIVKMQKEFAALTPEQQAQQDANVMLGLELALSAIPIGKIPRVYNFFKGLIAAKGVSSISKTIHLGKQGKHILGHNNYQVGKSILNSNPKTLLEGFHAGKFKTLRTFDNKAIIDFGSDIGTFYKGGNAVGPTRFGIIHHGKNGAHIVPANPIQF